MGFDRLQLQSGVQSYSDDPGVVSLSLTAGLGISKALGWAEGVLADGLLVSSFVLTGVLAVVARIDEGRNAKIAAAIFILTISAVLAGTSLATPPERSADNSDLVIDDDGFRSIYSDLTDLDDDILAWAELKVDGRDKEWQKQSSVEEGDRVFFRIITRAPGVGEGVTATNALVGVRIPSNISYVSGSTVLHNKAYPEGVVVASDAVADGGIDIGSYGAQLRTVVAFSAVVEECRDTTVVAQGDSDEGEIREAFVYLACVQPG